MGLWAILAGCAAKEHVVRSVELERGASAADIAAQLKLWMSPEEAKRIVEKMHPRRLPRDSGDRYETGPDEFLVLRFSMLRDPGEEPRMQLAEIAIRRFDDLQSRIPPELFPALRLIQRSPSPQGADFDPLPLIKAVNGLLPLGKEEALRALRTYVSLNPPGDYDLDPKRTFLIARLLFVRNDGDPRMPVMGIGGTDLPDTHDSPDWPLFPLALAKDVPFFLPWGYSLGGAGQAPTDHLDYCAANCVLRSQPLTPPVSPLAAAQSLFDSKEWGRLRSTGYGLFTEPTTENVRSHTQPRVFSCGMGRERR